MPVRSSFVAVTLIVFSLLISSCSFGEFFEPTPTPTPTRTRRPTSTPTPTETNTPVPTATGTSTATFTPVPPTATFTPLPATDTPLPTATFTRRPPTLTFTPAPPTNTPTPAGPPCPPEFPNCIKYRWVNPGQAFTSNQCTFPNGTRVEGWIRRHDGSVMQVQRRTLVMHLYIKGDSGGPFAYPGLYRDFPTEEDGRWNAEFPKRDNDFEWHVFLSAQFSDEPISADLWGIASGTKDGSDEGKCGKPGTRNYFAVDWVAPP